MSVNTVKSECGAVRVCIGCLETDGRLFDIREKHLEEILAEFTGLIVYGGLLCSVCLQLLRKFSAFRVRCVNACHIMQQLQPLHQDMLSGIDRTHLKLNLMKSKILLFNCVPAEIENQNIAKYSKLIKTAPELINISDENCITISQCNEETKDNAFLSKCKNPLNSDNYHINEKYYKKEIDFIVPSDTQFTVKDEMICLVDEFDDTKNVKLSNDVGNNNIESGVINTDILLHANDENLIDENQFSETIFAESVSNKSLIDDDDIDVLIEEKQIESKTKTKKVSLKEKSLVRVQNKLFNIIWTRVSRDDGDFYKLFERLYKESLNKDQTVCTKNSRIRKIQNLREIENLRIFLSLYRQVANLHNASIEFMSIEEQLRSMEEKRRDTNKELQCKLCCKNFRTAATYDRHMKCMHDESRPYKCLVCLYTFKMRPLFLLHLFKMHAVRRTCKDCGQLIVASPKTHWDGIKKHVQTVHRNKLVQCQFCDRKFTAPKFCYGHIREAHRAVMDAVQCWLCGDSFNGLKGIRGHMRRIHRGAVQCGVCSVWFVDGATMETHKRGGECDKELSGCPLCGAIFATERLMKEHYIDLHAKYKCEKCDQVFIELNSYKQHYYKVCNESRERLPRELTSSKPRARPAPAGSRGGNNNTSDRYKTNKNSLMCDFCGKSFDFPASLRYHLRLHTGEKPYKCKYCDKTFRLRATLKMHTTTHTDERPYKCKLCSKAFRQGSHLQRHISSHTNEKKHACSLCAKRFTSAYTMRYHVRTAHEGQSPKRRHRPTRTRAKREPMDTQ